MQKLSRGDFMAHYLRCNHCGYDMYGPEYLAHAIDSTVSHSGAYYPDSALLELSTRPDNQITCPYCHTSGDWSR